MAAKEVLVMLDEYLAALWEAGQAQIGGYVPTGDALHLDVMDRRLRRAIEMMEKADG
jgi:hypothetical protein